MAARDADAAGAVADDRVSSTPNRLMASKSSVRYGALQGSFPQRIFLPS